MIPGEKDVDDVTEIQPPTGAEVTSYDCDSQSAMPYANETLLREMFWDALAAYRVEVKRVVAAA